MSCGILYLTCLDEPEKPGTPEIVDWDKDHVDLEWTAPISDGGAPIEKLVVVVVVAIVVVVSIVVIANSGTSSRRKVHLAIGNLRKR